MSRFDMNHSVLCQIAPNQALDIVRNVLRVEHFEVEHAGPSQALFVRKATLLCRFWGVVFCKLEDIPAKVRVAIRQTPSETVVDLQFEEAMGLIGPNFVAKERYKSRFDHLIQAVGFALTHPTHAPLSLG